MKSILFICLICFALSVSDDDKGPAVNPKHPESEYFCSDYSVYQWNSDGEAYWYDDENDGSEITGVSDCADALLWDKRTNKYFDRCCYVRFQLEGEMHGGCIGLSEENYLDISETIRRMENGDKTIWTTKGANSKIYQIDCSASYLSLLTIASILLALVL